MKNINLNNVIELLEAAVDKKGREYVDPDALSHTRCSYAKDGAPSCIVGHVLVDLGVPVEELTDSGLGEVSELFNDNDPYYVEIVSRVTATGPALEVLSKAQAVQDQQGTWGDALDSARRLQERRLQHIHNTPGVVDE
ncbi:hypothetical protein CN1A_12 [Clavibacter phage CN1A]|uniref:Uncharacterized protein n=1 Tax=Clavibacter phage CN1A TaxID=1406793 RepID=U5PTP6_9CAUD|nr:hypothetical protein CN1A_12 [Clavibacter phage CN1A]AGY47121.1 hypothetical protein CN1A_12 [Clavibacter phage CN1A]